MARIDPLRAAPLSIFPPLRRVFIPRQMLRLTAQQNAPSSVSPRQPAWLAGGDCLYGTFPGHGYGKIYHRSCDSGGCRHVGRQLQRGSLERVKEEKTTGLAGGLFLFYPFQVCFVSGTFQVLIAVLPGFTEPPKLV